MIPEPAEPIISRSLRRHKARGRDRDFISTPPQPIRERVYDVEDGTKSATAARIWSH